MFNKILKTFYFIINKINLKRKKIIVSDNFTINGYPSFHGHIKFGNNCKINSGRRYNPIGGDDKCCFVATGGGKITIGNNVGISNSTFVSRAEIKIDDNVMIGGSCKIYDTDFHSLNYEDRMKKLDPDIKSRPVHIKKGAFIGAHSIILKGVTIGEKSIIGAGSVVTKAVPDGEIWGGNPAVFIRKV